MLLVFFYNQHFFRAFGQYVFKFFENLLHLFQGKRFIDEIYRATE